MNDSEKRSLIIKGRQCGKSDYLFILTTKAKNAANIEAIRGDKEWVARASEYWGMTYRGLIKAGKEPLEAAIIATDKEEAEMLGVEDE